MEKKKVKAKIQVSPGLFMTLILLIFLIIFVVSKNIGENKIAKTNTLIESIEETKEEKNKKENKENQTQEVQAEIPIVKQNKAKQPNIQSIIVENEKSVVTEKFERKDIDLEFTTQYKNNNSIKKGEIQTIQEGKDGRQTATLKCVYVNGELVGQRQVTSEVKEVAVNKIVEVGTAKVSNTYVPITGDTLEAVTNKLEVKKTANNDGETAYLLNKGDKVVIKGSNQDWYLIDKDGQQGWAKKNDFRFYAENSDGDENRMQYTREQLTQSLGFSMLLNRPSGLTIDQFKQIFENDPNDKNGVFRDHAEYFYYVENQYGINGLFVAAIGIHESGWATSWISQNKKNLFGYGAYDSDPANYAENFDGYAAGIDLVARVLMKYYLNPPGTPIYNGETAVGSYYRGSTVTAVNQCYATDTNWANAVYKWMMYLYNKVE